MLSFIVEIGPTHWLNIGRPENINFPFGTNEKLIILGVPILKHFRVCCTPKFHLYFCFCWLFRNAYEAMYSYTVELQWLKHLWNHQNIFEAGVVQANEC